MKQSIILIGGGGHCKSCIDVIEQTGKFQIAGIVDVPEKLHKKVLEYEVIASDEDIKSLAKEYETFIITIGQIKSPVKRIQLYEIIKKTGLCLPVIISPYAYVSRHAYIGEGSIVMHHALVNAGVRVGNNCIINTKALIEHDCNVGKHVHIGTGAIILGGCVISKRAFIGSGAVIAQEVKIGENAIVAAGSVVVKDVPKGATVKGIPAK